MRVLLVVFAALAACSRPDTTATTPRPLPLPLPSATATAAASVPAPVKRVCEPTIACGRWSRCTWLDLDHVEPTGIEVYRVEGSDAGGYGSRFWRIHDCWPGDAGPRGCSRYCDATGACADGLRSDGICTVSGPPTPSPWVCEIRGDACTTR
ncbi:MAG TPA: hypothetical protein VGH28_10220 [Polyangiaceae bacterium]|jgi:hypothetical protein